MWILLPSNILLCLRFLTEMIIIFQLKSVMNVLGDCILVTKDGDAHIFPFVLSLHIEMILFANNGEIRNGLVCY